MCYQAFKSKTNSPVKGLEWVKDGLGIYYGDCVFTLVLIAVYRQPDDLGGGHRSTNVEFRQALTEIKSLMTNLPTPTPDIVLCGDFNLPHLTWPEGTLRPGASRDEQIMAKNLIDLTHEHFLFQQITEPTHRQGNTLDLCFSNNPAFVHSYQCCRTIFSDHYIVEGRSTYSKFHRPQSYRQPHSSAGPGAEFDKLNFMSDEADWDSLENELDAQDWNATLAGLDPGEMLTKLLETCASISQKFIPLRKRSDRKTSRIPRIRRILMRRRCKVNKQMSSAKSDAKKNKLMSEAKDIEKKLQESYRNEKSEMEHKAVSAIKKNSKYFYSYAKKFSKIATGIGPFVDQANNIVTCPLKMAHMLADQYCSVFSLPKDPLLDAEDIFPEKEGATHQSGAQLCNIDFSEADIIKAICEISPTAAAGPDRFPAMLLKQCRTALSKPLYLIWRKSLDDGQIPHLLKTANIIPIHKGGTRGIPKNYRPIALTSHLIKIFEKVLRKVMVEYMERHGHFNPSQHGFRVGRSCLSQLIAHYDCILESLQNGSNVDVIYIDFAKAFDKVDFMVTLQKLKDLGITGNLGRWIHSFLTHRTQTVIVNESRSEPAEVKSGVPQGSVLGPLLFLILIGDIDRGVAQAFLSSFADDTRIGSHISSTQDSEALQEDLDSVYDWTARNNMELNGDKFESLRYGHNEELKSQTCYKSNSGTIIQEKEHVRDLGVIMSNDGTFRKHIQSTILEANKQCTWILRTFNTREVLPMLSLWKSLVLCKLDYCSQLWCPTNTGDIQALEMVQRSFLRKLSGMSTMSYWDQLSHLKQYSLERRRERYRIIYIWRILEGHVPNLISSDSNSEKVTAKWHKRRGRECIVPRVNRKASQRIQTLIYASLPVRGQQLFNILPARIRNTTGCSVDCFKRKLDGYLNTVPDEPQIPGYTAQRRAETNSLIDMARFSPAHNQLNVEVPGDSLTPDSRGCATSIAVAHWCQKTQQGNKVTR